MNLVSSLKKRTRANICFCFLLSLKKKKKKNVKIRKIFPQMPSFLPRLEHYSASIDLMHENGFSASSKEKKFSKANDTCGRIHWNRILKRWGAVVHLTLAETSRPWSFRGRSNTKLVRPLFCRSLTAEWANLLSMKRAESIFTCQGRWDTKGRMFSRANVKLFRT